MIADEDNGNTPCKHTALAKTNPGIRTTSCAAQYRTAASR